MVRFISVKPIGDTVVLDQKGVQIPLEGKRVQDDQYWYRMARRGSVVITRETAAAPMEAKKGKPISKGVSE